MADIEVENILREIRERVYAEEAAHASPAPGNNGGIAEENSQMETAGSLPRLESYLTTTARAWDRLPPLLSNRSGTSARIELWLKRHLKRATRWYAWEQINFNAAVHHALTDIGQLLLANQETIQKLREQLRAEREARQSETQTLKTQLESQQRLIAEQRLMIEAESAAILSAVEARAVARASAQKTAVDDRLAAIVNELRASVAGLQEEQRVCFKQVSLETSEADVLEDRARRKTEALLAQLKDRVEKLEAGKS